MSKCALNRSQQVLAGNHFQVKVQARDSSLALNHCDPSSPPQPPALRLPGVFRLVAPAVPLDAPAPLYLFYAAPVLNLNDHLERQIASEARRSE